MLAKPLCVLSMILCCLAGEWQEPAAPSVAITWQGLFRETFDPTTLIQWPDLPFSTGQFSSFDRASLSPQQPDDWFANHDRAHCLYEGTIDKETPYYQVPQRGSRASGMMPAGAKIGIARHKKNVPGYVWAYTWGIEPKLAGYIAAGDWTPHAQGPVLAEINGPGVLTRFWSSNPGEAGKVRIYLDHQPKPVLEARLLDLLTGNWEVQEGDKRMRPIPSPFGCERARGFELLFPIPFQQHCLVVVERPSLSYQIQYRQYPAGTVVKSFMAEELLKENQSIQEQATRLTKHGYPAYEQLARELGGLKADESADVKQASLEQVQLAPGAQRELILLEAPGVSPNRAIIQMQAQVQADRLTEALRKVVFSVNFDGVRVPQIETPLGDFFGTAGGTNPLSMLPWQVSAAGKLTSRWIMPYAKNARIVLKNFDAQPVTVQLELTHVPCRWTERSMHFHAGWKSATMNTRPYQDWLLLHLKGKGYLVGTFLSVHNPVKEWWGEGDSKLSLDGETFPSFWGTGTDDDFGLGWADKTIFSQPWRAQPRHDGKGHEGITSLLRVRILDRIAFTTQLKQELEVRHEVPNIDVQYAACSFWYALPGCTCERVELTGKTLQESLPGGQP